MRIYKPKNKKQRKIIKDWIARLRNPNSRQTQNKLKADEGNGYCCLGHLCKVVGLKFSRHKNSFGKHSDYAVEEESTQLPKSITNLLGLSENPCVCIGTIPYCLVELNDTHDFSLKEIADAVEADWIKGKPLKSHKKLKKT